MLKYPYLKDIPSITGRYIVLDTETTGLFCDSNHILEVAAIELKNGCLTGNQFHAYLKPRKNIESKALEKHSISRITYAQNHENFYESDKNIMENLLKFIGDSLVFAHNASFDLQFLNYELRYWDLPEIPIKNFRCTLRIFKNLFSNSRFKHDKGHTLSGCCQFFDIKFDNKSLHSAVYDATLTAKLVNCFYEFLEKNPEYLSNRVISNFSYLEAKKKEIRDLKGATDIMKNKNKEKACSDLNKEEKNKNDNFNKHVQVRKINLCNIRNDQDEKAVGDKINNTVANYYSDAKATRVNKNEDNCENLFSPVCNNKLNNNDNNKCFFYLNTEPKDIKYRTDLTGENLLDEKNKKAEKELFEIEEKLNKIKLKDSSNRNSSNKDQDNYIYESSRKIRYDSPAIDKTRCQKNKIDSGNNTRNKLNSNFECSFNAKVKNYNNTHNKLNLQADCDLNISQNQLKEIFEVKTQTSNKQVHVSYVKGFDPRRKTNEEKSKETKDNALDFSNSSLNENSEKAMEIDYLDNESCDFNDYDGGKKFKNFQGNNLKNTESKPSYTKKALMNNDSKAKTNKLDLEQLVPKIPEYKRLMKSLLMRENLN